MLIKHYEKSFNLYFNDLYDCNLICQLGIIIFNDYYLKYIYRYHIFCIIYPCRLYCIFLHLFFFFFSILLLLLTIYSHLLYNRNLFQQ